METNNLENFNNHIENLEKRLKDNLIKYIYIIWKIILKIII